MDSASRNIGTTPGASEPQGSAVVGGSGVKAGSNVAGPLRSSSCDREGAGAVSQAPVTLPTTGAVTAVSNTGTQPPQARVKEEPLEVALNALKYQLIMQQSGTKVLVQKANALQIMIADSKSPEVQSAFGDVMEAVEANKVGQDKVARAFKAAMQLFREQQDQGQAGGARENTQIPTCARCTEVGAGKEVNPEDVRITDRQTEQDKKLPRAEAEAKYAKLLDSLSTTVESLGMAVQAAPNTKLEIKTAVKSMGADFRVFADLARQLGMTRNPDALEISARQLKQQQEQQHTLTLKLLKEIREEQVRQNLSAEAGEANDKKPEQQAQFQRRQQQKPQRQKQQPQQQQEQQRREEAVEATEWTEVVNRKKVKAQKSGAPPGTVKSVGMAKEQARKQTRFRSRPSAILVDIKAEEFPVLAKKIRGGVNQEVIGDSVLGMRQAKSGGLLIEIRGDQARVEEVRVEISRAAGQDVPVRSLQHRAVVEVRDVDQWTTPEEVREAAATSVGECPDSIRIVSHRKGFGGSKIVLLSLPIGLSKALLSTGRLKVGWVSCRVRLAEQRVRCFRCLSFGHMSKECEGPDRTECCRRCGERGHKASSCGAQASVVSAFAKVVSAAGNPRS